MDPRLRKAFTRAITLDNIHQSWLALGDIRNLLIRRNGLEPQLASVFVVREELADVAVSDEDEEEIVAALASVPMADVPSRWRFNFFSAIGCAKIERALRTLGRVMLEQWPVFTEFNRTTLLLKFQRKLEYAENEGFLEQLRKPEVVDAINVIRELRTDGSRPVENSIAWILATYQELVDRPVGAAAEPTAADEEEIASVPLAFPIEFVPRGQSAVFFHAVRCAGFVPGVEALGRMAQSQWHLLSERNRCALLDTFQTQLEAASPGGPGFQFDNPVVEGAVGIIRDLPADGVRSVASKIARIVATYQEVLDRPPLTMDDPTEAENEEIANALLAVPVDFVPRGPREVFFRAIACAGLLEGCEVLAHIASTQWQHLSMVNRQEVLQSFHRKLQQAEAEGWVAELRRPEIVAIVATIRDLPVDGCQPVASKIARILATYQELVERPPWKQDEEQNEDEW